MSYRPNLVGHALTQFEDLRRDKIIYKTLMERIIRLVDEPWDAWPMTAPDGGPPFREVEFGRYGLIDFRVDDNAETITIFNITWAG